MLLWVLLTPTKWSYHVLNEEWKKLKELDFILIAFTYKRWEDDKVYPRGKSRGKKSQRNALRDTRLTGLLHTAPGFPPLPSQYCLTSCRARLSSCNHRCHNSRQRAAGTEGWPEGHQQSAWQDVTHFSQQLMSTKGTADTTWQLSAALQALMARWVASSHPAITLGNKNGQWWQHGTDLLECCI